MKILVEMVLFFIFLILYLFSNSSSPSYFFFQAFCLLKELNPEFIKQFALRQDVLFLSYLPVAPNCHRVVETSHVHADGPQLSFVSWFCFVGHFVSGM